MSKLSVTEQAIYRSGSGLLQDIALDRMNVVFATKEVRSRTAKADVLAMPVVETSGEALGWTSRGCDKLSVARQSIHHRWTATQMLTGPAT